MSTIHDNEPFQILKEGAEKLKSAFTADIDECGNFLNEQITRLIFDQDALNEAGSSIPNASTEFSEMKERVYMCVKTHIEKKEAQWQRYIRDMNKDYVANVQRLLATAELGGKMPSSHFKPSLDNKYL